jgi:hypothetical protein
MLPGQYELFPEITAPSSSLIGLQVRFQSPCGCGSTVVVLESSKAMHEAAIRCNECGKHRGWISRRDADALRAELGRLGKRPTEPISIF